MAASTYPRIGGKAWTALQSKAATTPSTKFTAEFVASLLGMANANSAQTNVIGPLRRLGLIDERGVLTDRGNKWRGDGSYAAACQEILDEVYPDELSGLVDDAGDPDVAKLRNWFELHFGKANARQMAATYALIARKQLPDSGASEADRAAGKKKGAEMAESQREVIAAAPPAPPTRSDSAPTLHLDIQIHIPADATTDQIDQIFASMARHLYSK